MSNALLTGTLLQAIAASVVTAWGSSMTIDLGQPNLQAPLPNCSIIPASVAISFETMTKTCQDHTFIVTGRWAVPTDVTKVIALEKVLRANELIAQLQTGASYATIGFLPLVTDVAFEEVDGQREGTYEVRITFTVKAEADHH